LISSPLGEIQCKFIEVQRATIVDSSCCH